MKNALRKQLREKRKTLSPTSHAEKSEIIRKKLQLEDVFLKAKSLLIYISTPEEVDTHALIKEAFSQNRTLYAPKIFGEKIVLCKIQSWEDLESGNFGVLEPKTLPEESAQKIDLILVPGIAFDNFGHRIGYGKGYYDKLLKSISGYKVGLAFSEQLINKVPHEAHDVPVDLIITDSALITLNPFNT